MQKPLKHTSTVNRRKKETTKVSGNSKSQVYKEWLSWHLRNCRRVHPAQFLVPFMSAFSESHSNFNGNSAFLGFANRSGHFHTKKSLQHISDKTRILRVHFCDYHNFTKACTSHPRMNLKIFKLLNASNLFVVTNNSIWIC